MKCGLLGRHLAHSYSPQIHSFLGNYPYEIFEKEPEQLADFLTNGDFTGINVTIPYKKSVIPYCTVLSDTAKALGAVNTIVRMGPGLLVGHNSDYFGFRSLLERTGLSVRGKKVLVLGSGGASNTAVAVLKEQGASVVIISRSGENNYKNLHLHRDTTLIVNTTPVGMYPDTGEAPLSLAGFPRLEGVIDVIYNPAKTRLLLEAEERGLVAENGLWMLVAQAWESAQWFTGKSLSEGLMEAIYRVLKNQMENIVLIGMPGCGKSTIGHFLAQNLKRQFVDADAEIVKESGMSIPVIFATQGEAVFRTLESQVLARLGKESGLIIATGGGCVTREENFTHLRQNGKLIWLTRSLDRLSIEGRPLSQITTMADMYATREPLYRKFAHITISNDGTPAETIDQILEAIQ